GLGEPASLHPVFDEQKCLGCKACITACPEGNVIGVINNKARLINPSHCIGHGACKKACPFDAISLVFGSAKRGVDIPFVSENFETNVPGIFIAGELGGMGLIRNAVEQGKQAMKAISSKIKPGANADGYDVVIVGAGPAGIAATLAAHDKKLKYLTLEQDSLGGTVFNFPRGKIVMTAPMNLPLAGKIKMTETTKEALLDVWKKIEKDTGIKIHYNEGVNEIQSSGNGFVVATAKKKYHTQAVLLGIGRRGSPRKLNVPGEELHKVVYRLIDPEEYKGKKVLVVGGGDSALEAALSIADLPGSMVILSYRSEAFSRVKEKNRSRIEDAVQKQRIRVMFSSNVKLIEPDSVTVVQGEQTFRIKNDAVIISAGGILPTDFLKKIGINVETKYGTA
ncbi:MAG: NAD(P)-binding domain-containing protein, partial [Gammaproteobacteria bacterium]|nr:NAD(P)-binding domain-containing protein [Gammaproteobacteria bacterium]